MRYKRLFLHRSIPLLRFGSNKLLLRWHLSFQFLLLDEAADHFSFKISVVSSIALAEAILALSKLL